MGGLLSAPGLLLVHSKPRRAAVIPTARDVPQNQCYTTLYYSTLYHITPSYTTRHFSTPYHTKLHFAMLQKVSRTTLYDATLSYITPLHDTHYSVRDYTLYYAMLCYAMLCYYPDTLGKRVRSTLCDTCYIL